MLCEFESTPIPDAGLWRHSCPYCGTERVSAAAQYTRFCDAPLATPATSISAVDGVVTGANPWYFPGLEWLVAAASEQGYPTAVADHGLASHQRRHLERHYPVTWIDCPPPQVGPQEAFRCTAPAEAWAKPFACQRSPWRRSLWIDADALPLRELPALFNVLRRGPLVTCWNPAGAHYWRHYAPLVSAIFGGEAAIDEDTAAKVPRRVWAQNAGVVGWLRGEPLIQDWAETSARILGEQRLLDLAWCRDQSALVIALLRRPELWERVEAGRANFRPRPGHRNSRTLLADMRATYPHVQILHWLGAEKYWGRIRQPARLAAVTRPMRSRTGCCG